MADIGVDFDGTCLTHEYPQLGRDIGAIPVLKALLAQGHRLILNTMRSGKTLMDAIAWFRQNDIHLSGINLNPDQQEWTTSPKVYAHFYIDDAAIGTPLIDSMLPGDRPFIDWDAMVLLLKQKGLLPVELEI